MSEKTTIARRGHYLTVPVAFVTELLSCSQNDRQTDRQKVRQTDRQTEQSHYSVSFGGVILTGDNEAYS